MKKLSITLFTLFAILGAVYALLQGNVGKNWVRKWIQGTFQQAGYSISIDQIDGTLPHQIHLKGVVITGNHIQISAQQISMRPVLWRLLDRELALNNVHAKNISLDGGAPFDFEGEFRTHRTQASLKGQIADWRFSAKLNLPQHRLVYRASIPLATLKGQATFNEEWLLSKAKLHIASNTLLSKLPFTAQGTLLADVTIVQKEGAYPWEGTWSLSDLIVEQSRVGKLQGTTRGEFVDGTILGEMNLASLAKATVELTLSPARNLIGTTALHIENLQALHIPNAYGKLDARAQWTEQEDVQGVHLDLSATEFFYGTLFAKTASIYSDLTHPFDHPKGLLDIELQNARWHNLELETISIETSHGDATHPFHLFAEGKWEHPIEIHAAGFWDHTIAVQLDSLEGTFYNHPFFLENPVTLLWEPNRHLLPNLQLTIGGASVHLLLDQKADETTASIGFEHLPIDFLSINPLEVPISGLLNLQAKMHQKGEILQGDLDASIEHMEVLAAGLPEMLDAQGRILGRFNKELLSLKGDLNVQGTPLLKIDASIPIHLSLFPLQAALQSNRPSHGHLLLSGRIENFLDFLNFGPHRLEGLCSCDLQWENTLYRPKVTGFCTLQSGTYENYYTGTKLAQIEAHLTAKENELHLDSFAAQDTSQTGTLSATGTLWLKQGDLFPFKLHTRFSQLQLLDIDLVTASANGQLDIEGNLSAALAKGNIEITQSTLLIPDHIPKPLPELQVTYINQIHPVPAPQVQHTHYPLHLDIQLTAPDSVDISGRGLTSQWSGEFHIGGTHLSPAARGQLKLVDGEFNFSARSFRLIDGSLSLSGHENEMPYLNIAGSTDIQGIEIAVRLKGPLNSPQITLQSSPPLPLGSIMSYLLFGQDVADISGLQALQLANSLASFAGDGPDVMESTRRSLGVDRLRVVTDPTEEGGQIVSIEVGKYVSQGVLITFKQSASDSTSDISVEIELKNNFIFQIESDQRQEQGIFTLKWRHNY